MPLCFTKHLQISLTIRKAYSKDGHNVNLDEKKLSVPDPLPPPQVSFFFFLFSCCEVKGQVLLSAVIWCESLEMWKYIWLLSFAFFFFRPYTLKTCPKTFSIEVLFFCNHFDTICCNGNLQQCPGTPKIFSHIN